VELYAVISPEGRVRSVTFVKGHRLFKEAAVEAVRQWEYKPSMLNGVPVQVEAYVNLDFKLTR
jgi:protein TonB